MLKVARITNTSQNARNELPTLAKDQLRELAHRMRREGKDKDPKTYIYLTDLTSLKGDSFHLDTHNRSATLKINYPPMEIELNTHKGTIKSVKRSWLSWVLFKNPVKVASGAIEYFLKHYNTVSVNKTFTERELLKSEQF